MSDPKPPISTALASAPISHFMTKKVVTASPATSVHIAMEMMLAHKISGLIVVDDSNTCLGIYSELDAMLQGAAQALNSPIKFTKPALTVLPETIFRDVLIQIVKKKLKRLPVVDHRRKVLGIVSRRDLMRAIHDDVKLQAAAQGPK